MAPAIPPRPATAPQVRAAAVGFAAAMVGSTASVSRRLDAAARKLTSMTLIRREARPAVKSEPP
jgi:hypothetical protein